MERDLNPARSLASIVIPCFNASKWLPSTLASLLEQGVDLEVILVDDGSTDDSVAVLRRVFPNSLVLRTDRAGPGGAREVGFAAATGTFVKFLDADDLLVPFSIRLQSATLEASGHDVCVGDWQRLSPEGGEWTVGERVRHSVDRLEERLVTGNAWFPPAAILFRRSFLEHGPKWRRDLRIVQDARFLIDCLGMGASVDRVDEVVASYRCHASGSVSTSDPERFARECAQNCVEISETWLRTRLLDDGMRAALVESLGSAARAVARYDWNAFEVCLGLQERILGRRFIPASGRFVRPLSFVVGYRAAVRCSTIVERLLSRFRAAPGTPAINAVCG